jgi:hypothetical protein
VYATLDPVLTYSVSPSLSGNRFFYRNIIKVVERNALGTDAIEQGTLSAGSNYAVTYVAKDFAITAKPITVTMMLDN